MKSLVLIVIVGCVSFLGLDLGSESILSSVVAPFCLFLSLIALAMWLVIKGGIKGDANSTDN
jgi:hypothetical protein